MRRFLSHAGVVIFRGLGDLKTGVGLTVAVFGGAIVALGVWNMNQSIGLIVIGFELIVFGWLLDRLIGE